MRRDYEKGLLVCNGHKVQIMKRDVINVVSKISILMLISVEAYILSILTY